MGKAGERLKNNKEGNTENVLTNDEVEIIDKKKEEKSKGEDESITDRSRAQENNNDKAEGKIDGKDKVEEVVEDSSKEERSDEKKDNEGKEDTENTQTQIPNNKKKKTEKEQQEECPCCVCGINITCRSMYCQACEGHCHLRRCSGLKDEREGKALKKSYRCPKCVKNNVEIAIKQNRGRGRPRLLTAPDATMALRAAKRKSTENEGLPKKLSPLKKRNCLEDTKNERYKMK